MLACGVSSAQKTSVALPESLVIARDAFWDMGPPNDDYDLIQITKSGEGLALDQVLVTPPGQRCLQPATVEERSAILHETMEKLIEGRNPCAIPERDLHREVKRCQNCMAFSGVNVTIQAKCGGKERQLRLDILDRDIYDGRTQTPENTSWSMRLMSHLDNALGPGLEAKPIFQIGVAPHRDVPNTPLVNAIRGGKFDELFGKEQGVSELVVEADQPPPPPPSVVIESISPVPPVAPDLPNYPPIAIAARIEGRVTVTFDVDAGGRAQNISLVDGPKMLQLAVEDAVPGWMFPESARGGTGQAVVAFHLNCK